MCEPTTIALAGLALSAVGTGVGVAGSLQQAASQRNAADYQAQVAKNNATAAQQNAAAVQQQAEAKAAADARVGAQRLGAQRAAIAANGVSLDSGSALDVQDATATNTALTQATDTYQGQLAAYGYENQGTNFTAQAGLDTTQAANATTAGYAAAGSSLLSGASQVASKWNSYKQASDPSYAGYGTPQMGGVY